MPSYTNQPQMNQSFGFQQQMGQGMHQAQFGTPMMGGYQNMMGIQGQQP